MSVGNAKTEDLDVRVMINQGSTARWDGEKRSTGSRYNERRTWILRREGKAHGSWGLTCIYSKQYGMDGETKAPFHQVSFFPFPGRRYLLLSAWL